MSGRVVAAGVALLTSWVPLTGCSGGDHQTEADEAWSPPGSTRQAIVRGGAPCGDDAHPAAVALVVERDGVVTFFCTGTLVAPDTVLTAAHCILPDEPGLAVSTLADLSRWGDDGTDAGLPPGAVRAIVAVAHPRFDGTFNNRFSDAESFDIGLLLLASPIAVEPMRLPTAEEMASLQDGDTVEVVGFGLNDDGEDGLKRCAFTDVTGQGPALLAVGDGQRLPSLCNGDSGGPTVAFIGPDGAPRLAGVASFGSFGCDQAAFAVKTEPHIATIEAEMLRWCEFGLRSDRACRSPGLPDGRDFEADQPGCASTPVTVTAGAALIMLALRRRRRPLTGC